MRPSRTHRSRVLTETPATSAASPDPTSFGTFQAFHSFGTLRLYVMLLSSCASVTFGVFVMISRQCPTGRQTHRKGLDMPGTLTVDAKQTFATMLLMSAAPRMKFGTTET